MAPPFGVSYIKRIGLTRGPFKFNFSKRDMNYAQDINSIRHFTVL